jgi:TetR/AcrR family transcriptional repressor of nem operon
MATDASDDPAPPAAARRRSRDESKRETREALIAAGVSAFAEEGLDGPSLDSICARAGYTRGAFYVHFKDRDDFLIAVMSTLLAGFIDAIIATGDAALDLQKTIDTFVGAVVAGAFPIRGGFPFHQVLAACEKSPRIREGYVSVLQEGARRIAVAVAEGQGAGTVRADVSADAIATMLVGLVMGIQAAIEMGYPFALEPAAADFSRMLKPPER